MALGLRYIVLLLPMAVSEIWGLTKRERGRTGRRPLSSALRPQYGQIFLNKKSKPQAKTSTALKFIPSHAIKIQNQHM